jgi:hypothetical protein
MGQAIARAVRPASGTPKAAKPASNRAKNETLKAKKGKPNGFS